jgi:hypothetical protein
VKLGEYEMANANTIISALKLAGIASDTPLTLTNPGGNNPWLFVSPGGFASNAGAPVALTVPVVQAEGVVMADPQAGINESGDNLWYADKNKFLVRAVGRVQPNSYAKTLRLYLFTGNGLGSGVAGASADVQIGFGSAVLAASSTGVAYTNWWLEAVCLWNVESLQMTGYFEGQIGGTLITRTGFAVNNPSNWAAQQAAASYNPLSFVVGANIASTLVGGSDLVVLDEFTADML